MGGIKDIKWKLFIWSLFFSYWSWDVIFPEWEGIFCVF